MKWRDVAVVGAVALVTAVAALPILCVGYAVAKEGPKAEIQWPVLRANGCEITLRTERASYAQGEMPVVQLAAANPSGSPVRLEASVRMTTATTASLFSRRVTPPTLAWEQRTVIELQPGESRLVPIPTNKAVQGATMVTFQLVVGSTSVSTRPLTIPGDAPAAPRPVKGQAAAASQVGQIVR